MEVYYAGEWGTVCDDGWGQNAAQVVCSELGFGPAISVRYNAYYGEGSGQIWLDNVICVGTELTIGSCLHSGWGVHNCDHDDDVGIKCTPSGIVISTSLKDYIVDHMAVSLFVIEVHWYETQCVDSQLGSQRVHCRSYGCIIICHRGPLV